VDRPAHLDGPLALDHLVAEPDVAHELSGGALAPPPQRVPLVGELRRLDRDRVEDVLARWRSARPVGALRPVPRPDSRVGQLADSELEVAPGIRRLGDQARGLRPG
jgi:hypothetical protein